MTKRIYVADKETLDATHANTKALMDKIGDSDYFRPKRYGIKINKADSNPKTRVTYIYDALNFTPASMNFANGTFDYGSWADVFFVKDNFPCMLNFDGTVAYKLDSNDYSLKEDGTASDIDNAAFNGNAMSAIPTIWYSQYEVGNYEYHVFCAERYDESYHAYCHERADGSIMQYRYFPMFEGYYDGTRLRSLSGKNVTASQTGATELTRATANGPLWNTLTWNMINLMKGLLTLISKSDDSQGAFGNGNHSGSEYLLTGQLNDKGQFFGYNTVASAVKVFHCENWWGNYWKRVRGLVSDHGNIKAAMKPPYSNDGANYIDTGIQWTGTGSGYIKETKNGYFGRLPIKNGGSASTYLCDYEWHNDTILAYAIFGGDRGLGPNCGALCVSLTNVFASAYSGIAASLSCEQPL